MKFVYIICLCCYFPLIYSQQPELILPVGHTSRINSVIFSHDGKSIFSSSYDNTVKRWDVATGMPVRTYKCGEAESVQLSNDGQYFITEQRSGWKSIVEISTGENPVNINERVFIPVCMSNDGKYFLSEIKSDHLAEIYETETESITRTLKIPHVYISQADISSDNKYLYTSSWDNIDQVIYSSDNIWDFNTGELVMNFDTIYDFMFLTVFSPDNKYILTIGRDSSKQDERSMNAILWNIESKKMVVDYGVLKGIVTSASFSKDGNKIIINTNEYRVLIETYSGKPIYSENSFFGSDKGWEFSPDGKYFIQIENNKEFDHMYLLSLEDKEILKILEKRADPSNRHLSTASIRESESGKLCRYLEGTPSKFISVSFSPDFRYVVSSHDDMSIKIWEVSTGMLIKSMEDHSKEYISVSFLPESNHFITAMKNGSVNLWDLSTGRPDSTINSGRSDITTNYFSNNREYLFSITKDCKVEIKKLPEGKMKGTADYDCFGHFFLNSPDNKYLILEQYDTISVVETETGKNIVRLAGKPYCAAFSPDSKWLFLSKYDDSTSYFIDINSGFLISRFSSFNKPVNFAKYSEDARYILLMEVENMETGTSKAFIYDNYRKKIVNELENAYGSEFDAFFTKDNKYVIGGSEADNKKAWQVKSGKMKFEFEDSEYCNFPIIQSRDGKLLILPHYEFPAIYEYNGKTFNRVNDLNYTEWLPLSLSLSPDQKYILASHSDNNARIWEANSGNHIYTLEGHSDELISSEYSHDGKLILTYSKDHTLKLWNSSTGKEIATLITVDETDWIIVTPDKYYFSSKGALKKIAWKSDEKIYNFEQFDLQYNRPDIVLERIGVADSNLIDAYRKAYYKRLKKLNIDEGMFSPEFHTPEIEILNRSDLPFIADNEKTCIEIRATDSKYKINRMNVFVNEVPVFGSEGLLINSYDSIRKSVPLILSPGSNKISVVCMNEKGAESLKERTEIIYLPKEKKLPDLYLIAVSSDDYLQSEYNLNYAVNDGRSLVELFQKSDSVFSHIYIDTLFNKNSTLENVKKLKEKLLKTTFDDHVMIFISGHGILDENLDFYFATHDVDFSNPGLRGLSYDDLEALLDSIPARNKLLLMDACHSGEVDKSEDNRNSEQTELFADIQFKGIKSYNFKRDAGKPSSLGLQNSFELMQELFTNVTKGSGAVIISAAAGSGYALEYRELEHGVFTYCILEGLKDYAADLNSDKEISVTELNDYISVNVGRYTGGKQKPTSRCENPENNFRIW